MVTDISLFPANILATLPMAVGARPYYPNLSLF
jgi:hypothetical protein